VDVPPARCLVVEDSERGICAAAAAGIPAVAVPNEWTRESDFGIASRCLASLDELAVEVVDEILATAAEDSTPV
jgi:beta-phosphoglucomutase-like phosphatase (HAD superfamily)